MFKKKVKRVIKIFRPFYWFLVKAYYLYLSPETRGVRVILTYRGEILFVKNTYGLKYIFPGGNLGKNENPEFGAKREVKEELGILLENLVFLGEVIPPIEFEYRKNTIYVFTAELLNKEINIDNIEIEDFKWSTKNNPPPMGHTANQIFTFYCDSGINNEF